MVGRHEAGLFQQRLEAGSRIISGIKNWKVHTAAQPSGAIPAFERPPDGDSASANYALLATFLNVALDEVLGVGFQHVVDFVEQVI